MSPSPPTRTWPAAASTRPSRCLRRPRCRTCGTQSTQLQGRRIQRQGPAYWWLARAKVRRTGSKASETARSTKTCASEAGRTAKTGARDAAGSTKTGGSVACRTAKSTLRVASASRAGRTAKSAVSATGASRAGRTAKTTVRATGRAVTAITACRGVDCRRQAGNTTLRPTPCSSHSAHHSSLCCCRSSSGACRQRHCCWLGCDLAAHLQQWRLTCSNYLTGAGFTKNC